MWTSVGAARWGGFVVGCASLAIASSACGPSSRRDADVPPNVVTFDDTCKLQGYFDERRAAKLEPVKAIEETLATTEAAETKKVTERGEGIYALPDSHARKRFALLLKKEYEGIEPKVLRAIRTESGVVAVRVRWSDRGGVRRLRPDAEVVVETAAGRVALPFNTCVGDFLFGDALYEARARAVVP